MSAHGQGDATIAKRTLIFAGVLALALVPFAWWSFRSEARLEAKRLNYWRNHLDFRKPETQQEFHRTMQETGAQQIPFILCALEARPSPVERLYLHLWSRYLGRLPQSFVRRLPQPFGIVYPYGLFRREALNALAGMPHVPAEAVPGLVQVIRDADGGAIAAAAHALARAGPRAQVAIFPLCALLRDQSPLVRLEAVSALAAINPRHNNVQLAFAYALDDSSPMVALAAAGSLITNQVQNPKTIVLLTRLSANPDSRIASDAAVLLRRCASKLEGAIPELVALLKSDDPFVRRRAAQVLGRIGPAVRPFADALRAAAQDGDGGVRDAAIEALSSAGVEWRL